ncbi:MAG: adenylate/guanylate cyclase domain-containing protein [Candidatus Tectimicrobiota bacterium]
MRHRKIRLSISSSLILLNTVLIVMTGLTVMFFSFQATKSSVYNVADNLLSEISKSVRTRTETYLQPGERAVRALSWLLWNQRLDAEAGREVLIDYFQELLQSNAEFKMVYTSDTAGNLVMARRMPDGSLSRRYVHRLNDGVHITWKHSNPTYFGEFRDHIEPLDSGYDPRKRPWYQNAVEKKGLVWSNLYIFATDRQPGFTCAMPLYNRQGTLLGVTAVDISVIDLSYYLATMQVTDHSRLFITDATDRIVALQMREQTDIERLLQKTIDSRGFANYEILKANDIGDPVLSAIVDASHNRDEHMGTIHLPTDGGLLHARVIPLVNDRGIDLRIGVIIPDDDIMGVMHRNNYFIVVFSLGMIVLAVLLSLVLSRSIARPMHQLSAEMKRIEQLDLGDSQEISTIITEIDDMQGSFDGMKTGLQNFRRYVPADLVSQLVGQKQDASLGGECRQLTILFSDIANFTAISEHLEPEVLVEDMCEYFNVISRAIRAQHGTLDKYIGDSVMAFWGAPVELTDHAYRACLAAVTAQDHLAHLFRQWENKGKTRFTTRIGIHTAEVVVGNMGYEERLNYTVIGDGVNLASRLEGLNKYYGTSTLVSQTTQALAQEHFEFRHIDRVAVKGKTAGVDVFELLALKGDLPVNVRKLMDLYEGGLLAYFQRDWKFALQHFSTVLKYRPGDGPSQVLAARCRRFIDQPPPETWNLTWERHEK